MDKDFLKAVKNIKRKCKDKAGAIGVYRFTLENPDGSKEVKYYKNVITIAAFQMILNNMSDPTPDNDMLVNYACLGSNAAVASVNDTQLGTETYRNGIASMTSADNVGYFTSFFDQTEVVGTFKEAGFVSDGTASANTGILISHANIDVTKTNVQKLTVDYTITFVNA